MKETDPVLSKKNAKMLEKLNPMGRYGQFKDLLDVKAMKVHKLFDLNGQHQS